MILPVHEYLKFAYRAESLTAILKRLWEEILGFQRGDVD